MDEEDAEFRGVPGEVTSGGDPFGFADVVLRGGPVIVSEFAVQPPEHPMAVVRWNDHEITRREDMLTDLSVEFDEALRDAVGFGGSSALRMVMHVVDQLYADRVAALEHAQRPTVQSLAAEFVKLSKADREQLLVLVDALTVAGV